MSEEVESNTDAICELRHPFILRFCLLFAIMCTLLPEFIRDPIKLGKVFMDFGLLFLFGDIILPSQLWFSALSSTCPSCTWLLSLSVTITRESHLFVMLLSVWLLTIVVPLTSRLSCPGRSDSVCLVSVQLRRLPGLPLLVVGGEERN